MQYPNVSPTRIEYDSTEILNSTRIVGLSASSNWPAIGRRLSRKLFRKPIYFWMASAADRSTRLQRLYSTKNALSSIPWQSVSALTSHPWQPAANPGTRPGSTREGPRKTCSTARSRQGGSRRNALLVDCFGIVSRRPQLRHGVSAMSPGLRNVTKAFHMCSPVILHAAMAAQTESGGLVML